MSEGLVYNIQRLSLHDGPGIRTTVFLKGCPLHCLWCSNPESQSFVPEMLYFENQCQHCGICVAVCPTGALSPQDDGTPRCDRRKCLACGACTDACPHDARSISGKLMSPGEVIKVVKKDRIHYQNSDGGMTVSGGEPLAQPYFLLELLKAAREDFLHTCLDTCGFAKWEIMEKILKYTDLVLFDVKHLHSAEHQRLTGVDNTLILDNLKKVAKSGVPVRIRLPLIPGLNDSDKNIMETGQLVESLGLKDVDLIFYHMLGLNKYKALGMEYRVEDKRTPYAVEHAVRILESFSLQVNSSPGEMSRSIIKEREIKICCL
ncbi:MAG: glycyl-radical enzyme activating protein [Deltaproteobacteria bacterium HGW-Deltaproteobacteria-12]|nr:MAG: glycyl-radical enzyme activating protein [Deltaproteobacteria bacterium HGW-Deltaproteobacteria-12]